MGAMLVSLALYIPVIIFAFICTSIFVAIMAFAAYKSRMNVLWWSIGSIVFSYLVLIPFIIVNLKIDKLKCPECGASTKNNTGVCPDCNANVKRIDDKKIIQRLVLADLIIFAVGILICVVISGILYY